MRFTLRDLLNIVFRYGRPLLIFWVVTVCAMAIFYTQTAKKFDSTARILVSIGSEAQGRAEYLNAKNLQLAQREQQIHNEQQILESHDVLLTTARWILGDPAAEGSAPPRDERLAEARRYLTGQEPEPTVLLRAVKGVSALVGKWTGKPKSHDEEVEDLAEGLSKSLGVKTIYDSDALDVSFRYRNPRVAQTVLNLVMAAYMDHHIAVFQSAAESTLLKGQLDRSVSQYHKRLNDLSSYMAAHRLYNDETQATAMVEDRERLQQALNEAIADRDAAAARFNLLKTDGQTVPTQEPYSTTETRNKEREELSSKLNAALLEEQELLSRHPVGSRAYEEQHAKIEKIRSLMAAEPAQVVAETEQRKTRASELVDSDLITVNEAQQGDKARIAQLRSRGRTLDAELSDYARGLEGFNALKLDLAFARQESEQMATAYVDSRLRTLTAQNAITDVSVIDAPTWDPKPASPKKSMVAAATLALLLLGSFAVVLACFALDPTMPDGRTAQATLGLPIAADLPLRKNEADPARFAELFEQENTREFAKLYQGLRGLEPAKRMILIAGSKPGDGTSLIGYGMARFLGQHSQRKVAFVDLTERRIVNPGQGAAESSQALSVLRWPTAVQAAGQPSSPSAVAQWTREFDCIVLAGRAIQDATDATELLAINPDACTTYLVVDAGKTRRATARHSLDTLSAFGFQAAGVILNKRTYVIPRWLMRFV